MQNMLKTIPMEEQGRA